MAKMNWSKTSGSGTSVHSGRINKDYEDSGRYTGGESKPMKYVRKDITGRPIRATKKKTIAETANELKRLSERSDDTRTHIVDTKTFSQVVYGDNRLEKKRKGKSNVSRKTSAKRKKLAEEAKSKNSSSTTAKAVPEITEEELMEQAMNKLLEKYSKPRKHH